MNTHNILTPDPGKIYKLFLVEVDDDNRERVLAGKAVGVKMAVDHNYADIESGYGPVGRFITETQVTVTMKLVPDENGTYFRIEDFSEEPYPAGTDIEIDA